MSILELIAGQLNNEETLNKLGQSVGANPSQVQQLAQLAMPALLEALGRNAGSPEGSESLASALEQHQDDNVEDVDGFLNAVNPDEGSKILQHIFPENTEQVQDDLAKQTGMETGQVSGILAMLAPLLLGALGQEKKQQNVDAAGIPDLLSGLLSKGNFGGLMGMVTNLLDANQDGSIMDEVGTMLSGALKKQQP